MKIAAALAFVLIFPTIFLIGCETEAMRRNDDLLRQQETEIRELRREVEAERAAKKREDQRTQDCTVAFLSFEKAQAARDPRDAVALYREGLKFCPDDDVAHYELGKILAGVGSVREAREEFESALKINTNFQGAKQELEKINRR
jgi:tetratricopeptide (TPR) repeat protein